MSGNVRKYLFLQIATHQNCAAIHLIRKVTKNSLAICNQVNCGDLMNTTNYQKIKLWDASFIIACKLKPSAKAILLLDESSLPKTIASIPTLPNWSTTYVTHPRRFCVHHLNVFDLGRLWVMDVVNPSCTNNPNGFSYLFGIKLLNRLLILNACPWG